MKLNIMGILVLALTVMVIAVAWQYGSKRLAPRVGA